MKDTKSVTNNIIMLYIMNITQLILPLLTLPYLTRVLSVDGYGVVSYTKSIMIYATLIIEFGFLLSGTKEVVDCKGDRKKLGVTIGKITQAKLLLSLVAFSILLLMILFVPILHRHPVFTILSYGSPFLSIFLFDYLFRGLEKMQIITERYLISKGISTIFTFLLIKNEGQLNLIPILDIAGSLVAAIWVLSEIKKLGIKLKFDKLSNVFTSLKISFTYFLSEIAATAFSALNTFFVGLYLSATDVAFWGITMSLISAVQSMYSPISNGIYPHMIKTKSLKLFTKIVLFFIPILVLGGAITYFGAPIIMRAIGGVKYINAAVYLQESVPLLIISFFSILFGWPLLGAIGKVKETTLTTVTTAILQVVGIGILIFTHHFTIGLLIMLRTLTELFMATFRIGYVFKYHSLFSR